MLILGLDSSTIVSGVAIFDSEKEVILAESFLNTGNTHSEKFLPLIKSTLEQANLSLKDIEGIAVTKGPGSFTGLRIGMVTAKSLVQVTGTKLMGIKTLDALAYNLFGYSGIICPILNARKSEVYTALYQMQNNELKRISEYLALTPEKLVKLILENGSEVMFLGDGVPEYRAYLEQAIPSLARFASSNNLLTRSSSVAILGAKGFSENKEDSFFTLEPFYLRKSEAEITLEAKQCAMKKTK
ncbi:tRNA threonylcarbamoyladenosine biosynthesis protein TsaB [Desulfonispora thiosulfatigenes DSM 11270]|uniref:tRNA threonylcarbamoyladenosine biosynthesis protein TsaB n=1 Tax=Desulfonispora thiosulfatigenes DSM 11270 TaxID=656914 RepID=A0A1W1V8B0_DESTI|nr:tRNA (adenosine(37)-N6)-threonylcarbamoyltransferase complex dimerization subunit type 1 TsaB [Desulfonispora thiosulfatigenes]SMB89717.1 tRNA threonylcarbamoyladenosine biosynthesis protein TsaB [Desulfonispora thiosulfatigenes DSM 11270]